MFFKSAISKSRIYPVANDEKGLFKFASSDWIGVKDFPDRYQQLVANYVKANSVVIGKYNPEFKYYRVIALHGDIPNDNGDFWYWGDENDPEKPELLRFEKNADRYVYQSFVGRGNYKNHDNDDVSKAVGLILDVAPNSNGKFIEALLAVDKQKDPELVRSIDMGYVNSVSMGCVKAGTPIMLPDGHSVPIEKLHVGQEVLTHLGNSKKIKNLQIRRYKNKIYKIYVMGNQEPLYITDEHPIWAIAKEQFQCQRFKTSRNLCTPQNKIRTFCKYRKNNGEFNGKICEFVNKDYKFEFIETKKLKVGDWVAFPFSTEVNHPDYATKDLARLMGYYLSEGFCLKNKKGERVGLSFCLNVKETEFIEEIVHLLKKLKTSNNNPVVKTSNTRKNIVDINLYDKELSQKIHNLCGEYAKYKKLDQSVLYWKPEIQLELIGTWINGDGCSLKTPYHNGSIHGSSASSILINQLSIMLLRNGIVPYVRKIIRNRDRKIQGHKIIDGIQYQIDIGTYYNEKLSKVAQIKSPTRTTNNYTKRRFIYKNYLISRITKIETEDYDDLVYNFEVEEDNSYVANNIAVHNCLVEYSICSICGNQAKNEHEYCSHVKYHKGQRILHEGEYKLVYEDNRGCNFIELSWVTVPADPGAKLLEKVAKNNDLFQLASQELNEEQFNQWLSFAYGYLEDSLTQKDVQYLNNVINLIKDERI